MRLHEEVWALKGEVGEERASRTTVVSELQAEVENGSSRVTQLEGQLRQCQAEMALNVTKMERETAQHRADTRQTKRQVKGKYSSRCENDF